MTLAFENSHVFHLGMGGNRKTGRGMGCNCKVNIIKLTHYEHSVLDGRVRHNGVEYIKQSHKAYLEMEPKAYRHKMAWAIEFNYKEEVRAAIEHHQERNYGKTFCAKGKV